MFFHAFACIHTTIKTRICINVKIFDIKIVYICVNPFYCKHMEIDAKLFWSRMDTILAQKKITLREICANAGISYSTISSQRVRITVPKLEQMVAMSDYLNLSLDEVVLGKTYQPQIPDIALAVMQNTRLQTIVSALLASPDKLSAIETLLGVKQVPPDVKSLA